MADNTESALDACIKALETAVRPSLDGTDPLAREQLHLTTGYLKFLRARLCYWQSRQLFELRNSRRAAESLIGVATIASDGSRAQLAQAVANARALEASDDFAADRVRQCLYELNGLISNLVRAASSAAPDIRQKVEQATIASSKAWILMQRSWFAPLGFDLRAGELPKLDTIFRQDVAEG